VNHEAASLFLYPYRKELEMAKKTNVKPKAVKTAKPKIVKISETELDTLQEADEILHEIEEKELEMASASVRMSEIKSDYQEAKAHYSQLVSEMCKLSRRRKEKLPLFEQPKEPEQKPSETWKAATLEQAGIIGDIAKLAIDAGIKTVGELQGHIEKHGEAWAVQITGTDQGIISEDYAAAINSQLKAFFKTNPNWVFDATLPSKPANILDKNGQLTASGKATKVSVLKSLLTEKQFDALESAFDSLGSLQEAMRTSGEWWHKNAKINGRFKLPIEDALTTFLVHQSP
jgi:hypothetical protein